MAVARHIKNPVEWVLDAFARAGHSLEEAGRHVGGLDAARYDAPPEVHRITIADLQAALARGFDDFTACRTDVIALFAVYPLIGLVLARLTFGYDMLPLLFPLAAGFALIGPVAAVGLYQMSRAREQGAEVNWAHAFSVVQSPRFGAIVVLGLLLLGVFVTWLIVAQAIYMVTLGPAPPVSFGAFLSDVFTTAAGWTMIVVGLAVGALFAIFVLTISVVSFPLLLDRDVGLPTAMATSIRAVAANPGPMLVWGLIVAIGLALGMLPLFLGLAVVVPVLGHATWHLYRTVVKPAEAERMQEPSE